MIAFIKLYFVTILAVLTIIGLIGLICAVVRGELLEGAIAVLLLLMTIGTAVAVTMILHVI